jgi:NADPH-dependent dioxygenase
MEARTRVVVVGAGPVGLLTALVLAQRNVDVMVIDQTEPASARSFAVVLHPRTVAMLANLGIVEPLHWQGQSFRRLAIFADGERQALLELPLDGEHADGALTLPQNVLRSALEHALSALGVEVAYGFRLASFEQTATEVHARFTGTKTDELHTVSEFLVGADGHESSVRTALGSAMLEVAPPRTFAFFDVPQPAPCGTNAELVLGAHSAAIYPLHGGGTRYSFALDAAPSGPLGRAELRELVTRIMPWHAAAATESVEWSGTRRFRKALADRFGRGRVWLAGDACHLTSPLGAQSLNVGLREARDLAHGVSECLRGTKLEELGTGYAEQRQMEWRRLLGVGAEPVRARSTPGWVKAHTAELVCSLPASGDDLDELLDQLATTLL